MTEKLIEIANKYKGLGYIRGIMSDDDIHYAKDLPFFRVSKTMAMSPGTVLLIGFYTKPLKLNLNEQGA